MNSAAVKPSPPTRNQSQWAITWREFRKQKLAMVAATVILFLVTSSIFAPFLAKGAPIYYVGINRTKYQNAATNLRALSNQLIESRSKENSTALANRLLKAVSLQVDIMSEQLPAEKVVALRDIGQQILTAAKSSDDASAGQLKEFASRIRSEFDSKSVTLVTQSHWPVIATLNGLEVGFMTANVLLLLFPFWNWMIGRSITVDKDARRNWCRLAIQIGIPVCAGVLWWWIVPGRIDLTKYKSGVFESDENAKTANVVYQFVIWPPITYDLDEYEYDEKSMRPAIYPAEKDAKPIKLKSRFSGPHWLGTDRSGKDLLCRLIWGGRVSLSVGLVAVTIYVAIGIVVGAIAGYFRGICDIMISRMIEVMICFPTFFLILTVVAFFGPSIMNIMLIIGLTGWTGVARLVRSEFLRLVDQEFVLAGRALGYSPARIIFRHILPNSMAPVLVSATFGIAGSILTESALSFLGLGVSKPTPSWGALLSDGRDDILSAPWLIHFPGLLIFIVITAYNVMGEALRDASDPRLRGSR